MIVSVAALALAACNPAPESTPESTPRGATAHVGSLTIVGAWARPALKAAEHGHGSSASGPVSAAYLIIENKGAADKLLSLSTPAAEVVEIHQTLERNGMMMMEPLPNGLDIPANGSVTLKPGGIHFMLMNVKEDMKLGSTIQLTLNFESGATLTMDVPILEN